MKRRETKDHTRNENGGDEKDSKKRTKTTGCSCFDIILIAALFLLIVGMSVLKAREELFAKDKHHMEMVSKGDDYYMELGLAPGAKLPEIKRKYRELAMAWHPDKNPGCSGCMQKFERISAAYKKLLEDAARGDADYSARGRRLKLVHSESISLTKSNFEEEVLNGQEIWLVRVFDPEAEGYKQTAALWESFYKDYGGIISMGQINAIDEPELVSQLPFKIQVFPSIISFSLDGTTDLLPYSVSFNPDELKSSLKELLNPLINKIQVSQGEEFLKKNDEFFSKYNVVLLRQRPKIPYPFFRSLITFHGILDFAVVEPSDRKKFIQHFNLSSSTNLAVAFNKQETENTKRYTLLQRILEAEQILPFLQMLSRHSIIQLYQNNFKRFCLENKNSVLHNKNEENEGRRLLCVLGLVDHTKDINSKLMEFQKHVHKKFEKAHAAFTKRAEPFDTQYGVLSLEFHKEFEEFLFTVQHNFHLKKDYLNYLLLTADNEGFSIISAKTLKELESAINDFMNASSNTHRDYFSNYDKSFIALIISKV